MSEPEKILDIRNLYIAIHGRDEREAMEIIQACEGRYCQTCRKKT